ncbi:unnamed protein product [Amoebophrya sp. A25]|nr:unnamed protein product [Amoebophrya sp. A25]|eukprot:GSA25T00011380001.1
MLGREVFPLRAVRIDRRVELGLWCRWLISYVAVALVCFRALGGFVGSLLENRHKKQLNGAKKFVASSSGEGFLARVLSSVGAFLARIHAQDNVVIERSRRCWFFVPTIETVFDTLLDKCAPSFASHALSQCAALQQAMEIMLAKLLAERLLENKSDLTEDPAIAAARQYHKKPTVRVTLWGAPGLLFSLVLSFCPKADTPLDFLLQFGIQLHRGVFRLLSEYVWTADAERFVAQRIGDEQLDKMCRTGREFNIFVKKAIARHFFGVNVVEIEEMRQFFREHPELLVLEASKSHRLLQDRYFVKAGATKSGDDVEIVESANDVIERIVTSQNIRKYLADIEGRAFASPVSSALSSPMVSDARGTGATSSVREKEQPSRHHGGFNSTKTGGSTSSLQIINDRTAATTSSSKPRPAIANGSKSKGALRKRVTYEDERFTLRAASTRSNSFSTTPSDQEDDLGGRFVLRQVAEVLGVDLPPGAEEELAAKLEDVATKPESKQSSVSTTSTVDSTSVRSEASKFGAGGAIFKISDAAKKPGRNYSTSDGAKRESEAGTKGAGTADLASVFDAVTGQEEMPELVRSGEGTGSSLNTEFSSLASAASTQLDDESSGCDVENSESEEQATTASEKEPMVDYSSEALPSKKGKKSFTDILAASPTPFPSPEKKSMAGRSHAPKAMIEDEALAMRLQDNLYSEKRNYTNERYGFTLDLPPPPEGRQQNSEAQIILSSQ